MNDHPRSREGSASALCANWWLEGQQGFETRSSLPGGRRTNMRKVLLVAYWYPPRQSSGSQRPAGLAKYLPEFGWEPVILTPKLPDVRRPFAQVVQTGYQDVLQQWKARLRLDPSRGLHEQLNLGLASRPNSSPAHTKIIDCVKSWLACPDAMKGWVPFAMAAVSEMKPSLKFDAIVTTSPPESCHLIGSRVKKALNCPWVADFRDLWTQDLTKHYGPIRKFVESRLERRTLCSADALVTLSGPWAEK